MLNLQQVSNAVDGQCETARLYAHIVPKESELATYNLTLRTGFVLQGFGYVRLKRDVDGRFYVRPPADALVVECGGGGTEVLDDDY
eukprot:SAG25_NODE_326_length_9730_cov_8.520195_13_plen_86_part_00